MDKQLRLIAGAVITESKIGKTAKLQLLQFVKEEASDAQIKALLMDGEIISDLDDQAADVINARFANHPVQEQLLSEGGWKTLFGAILFGPGVWVLYRAVRAMVDKKSAMCGALRIGRERDVCLWKLRAEEAQKMVGIMQKAMGDCKNSKNPQKCTAKAQEMVAKYKTQYEKNMQKIKTYSDKSLAKKAKASAGLQKAKEKKERAI